jgi:hypothetical protein
MDKDSLAASVALIPGEATTFDFRSDRNPFRVPTTIRYSLPINSRVHLCVYDVAGRVMATLVDNPEGPEDSRLMRRSRNCRETRSREYGLRHCS